MINPKIESYFTALEVWNRALRLTGAKDKRSLITRHLDDAICLSETIPSEATILDIGSGGGLPGIPFAILRPDCRIHLVEPIAKKCAFLRSQSYQIGLDNCIVHRARFNIDSIQIDYLEQSDDLVSLGEIDVIWSLATFNPNDLMKYGERLFQKLNNIEMQITFVNFSEELTVDMPCDSGRHSIVVYANKRKALRFRYF